MRHEGFQGAKLRVARLLSGWSKGDLADQLHVSRQFIHSLEIDEGPPNQEMIAALCLLLKVQPAFFFDPLYSEVREDECHFRSRRTLPDKMAQQIVSRGTALEIIVRFLDNNLDLPAVNFPSFEVNAGADIEEAATQCRERWGLGVSPVPNMCRVLESAGAIVTLFDGNRHEVDALSMARARPIVIRNSHKQHSGLQRLDLAHECGHLVLHQGVSTGDRITEAQADHFAAALLLPRASFAGEFAALSGRLERQPIDDLALRWGVDARALLRRGHDFGLLGDDDYARCSRQSGQRSRGDGADARKQEEPQLLKTAIAAYLSAFACTPADFARALGMTPSMVEQLVGLTTLRSPRA